MTDNLRHLIAYVWSDQCLHLSTRTMQGATELIALRPGGSFRIGVRDQKRCIGWADFDTMEIVPCPLNASVSGSGVQCNACREQEGYYPCMMCNGQRCPALSPRVERYCRQTHFLYLLCFGTGIVKVGTASASRKVDRVFEQGPTAAVYVASGPGPRIKQLEKAVSAMGYTERYSRRHKQDSLSGEIGGEAAAGLLRQSYDDISSRLEPGLAGLLDPLEPIALPKMYSPCVSYETVVPLDLAPGQSVAGTIVGSRGGFLVLVISGMLSSLDLSRLRGWIIDLDPGESTHTGAVQQLALF